MELRIYKGEAGVHQLLVRPDPRRGLPIVLASGLTKKQVKETAATELARLMPEPLPGPAGSQVIF